MEHKTRIIINLLFRIVSSTHLLNVYCVLRVLCVLLLNVFSFFEWVVSSGSIFYRITAVLSFFLWYTHFLEFRKRL